MTSMPDSNAHRISEERRFDRNSWVMLALASTILLYSLALALYVARLPTDGWEFQFNLTQPNPEYIFTEYHGSEPSPLQSGDALVAIALSILGTAAIALPLRNRIQAAINRAFYRQKYDAQKTLEAFVAGLQTKTDLEGLAAEARAVIQETLQPASVKVWLAAEETQESTAFAAAGARVEIARVASNDPIIAHLQRARSVVQVKKLQTGSPALQAMQTEGTVLVAPLVHQGQFIGLITLGPRRSEQGYATDDYQLLNNLATQAAPAFRVADLVREQCQEAQQ